MESAHTEAVVKKVRPMTIWEILREATDELLEGKIDKLAFMERILRAIAYLNTEERETLWLWVTFDKARIDEELSRIELIHKIKRWVKSELGMIE